MDTFLHFYEKIQIILKNFILISDSALIVSEKKNQILLGPYWHVRLRFLGSWVSSF